MRSVTANDGVPAGFAHGMFIFKAVDFAIPRAHLAVFQMAQGLPGPAKQLSGLEQFHISRFKLLRRYAE